MKFKREIKYKIKGEVSEFKLARRLCELGFVIGETIQIKHSSIFNKTYLVVCRNSTVTLSKNILNELGLFYE